MREKEIAVNTEGSSRNFSGQKSCRGKGRLHL